MAKIEKEFIEFNKKIADFYGATATGVQLLEEMGELMQAVVKYLRVRHKGILIPTSATEKETVDNIAEEIADVKICLRDFEYLLGIEEDVKEWECKKRKREKVRMRNEKKRRKASET